MHLWLDPNVSRCSTGYSFRASSLQRIREQFIYLYWSKYSVVQYADDTMVLTSRKKIESAKESLELNVNNICDFFEKHQLTLNADKTEFNTFQTKNNKYKNTNLIVEDEVIRSRSTLKYLGVYLDQNLTFQEEVKHILRKMACGIKTLYSIRDYFPEKVRLLLLNALVISHLHYPEILLNGWTEYLNTTLEKQLNWGIKACFIRTKYYRSSDLKIKHNILPIRYFLKNKSLLYFWKWKNNLIPAFRDSQLETDKIRKQSRTETLYFNTFCRSDFLRNSFFKKTVTLWNTLPKIYAKSAFSLLPKSKLKTSISQKWKPKSTFLNMEKNVGATTDLNSVHRLCSFSSCLLPFKLASILITLFLL